MTDPTIERLAAATLLPGFDGHTPPYWLRQALEGGLGGVVLFANNIGDPEQLTALVADLHAYGDRVVGIDEEGGDVTRLGHHEGSPYPGNAALGRVDDSAMTHDIYHAMGTSLARLGIDLDLAPTVDVNSATDNPVIGTRAFGADPLLVARHAEAAVRGLQQAGVAAAAKHFPGHGRTSTDSHLQLPTLQVSLADLRAHDLPPFEAVIRAGSKALVTAHIRLPDLTGGEPATVSRAALTGLLRDELGFGGAIVTDALDMGALANGIGMVEGAVRAVAAGADLLCLGTDQGPGIVEAVRSGLVAAVEQGRIARTRLEEAASRAAGLAHWAASRRTARRADATVAGSDGAAGRVAARRAVQVTGRLPDLTHPMVVELVDAPGIAAGPVPWGLSRWLDGDGDALHVEEPQADPPTVLARAEGRSLVVVVRDAHRHRWQQVLVERLLAARDDIVLVEMGLPVWQPPGPTYVATYGAAAVNGRVAAELLFGTGPSPTSP